MSLRIKDENLDRMARFRLFIASVAFLTATAALAGSQKKTQTVNYDDPNMAFTTDYVSDTAATCPRTLKGKKLRECLVRNGLAASEEISAGAENSSEAPPSSFH